MPGKQNPRLDIFFYEYSLPLVGVLDVSGRSQESSSSLAVKS